MRLEDQTLWLSQAQMAELFATSSDNIGLHLKNIYREQELQEEVTTEDFSVVRQEGQRQVQRKLKHYNPDAIISVGYRVKSLQGTRFRQWATTLLRERMPSLISLRKASSARFFFSSCCTSARNSSERMEISGLLMPAAARMSTISVETTARLTICWMASSRSC